MVTRSAVAVFLLAAAAFPGTSVLDPSGAPVAGARVEIRTPGGALVSGTMTGAGGEFEVGPLPEGRYLLRVAAPGFAPFDAAFDTASPPAKIELHLAAHRSAMTVTATRGSIEEVSESPQVVVVRDDASLPLATLGNALENTPGITVQQSAYGQVSPFLRGLTGYHVVNLVDGVRFNNSTFRSGPNQYLAYVEPSQAGKLEAMLGPSGVQYGSDSLGGTIQVVTREPRFGIAGLETHGEVHLHGASADASGGADAQVSLGNARLSWLLGGSGRRQNDLRAGAGEDSRNVFVRLFGLHPARVREFAGSRQQDTAFSQYGVHTKLAARPAGDQLLTLWYQRSVLHGVRGYKDLLGGLGRLQAGFEPQGLDFFYTRYEKLGLGPLESLSGTFSVNSQSDGFLRQNFRNTDPITRDDNRVKSYGYSVQAAARPGVRQSILFGADFYDERIRSSRFELQPSTGLRRQQRALYPDGSTYLTQGLFAQASSDLFGGRLRASGGGRFTSVRFRSEAQAALGVADARESFHDFTFHTSLAWYVSRNVKLHALVGRGFRAPNLNDFGALGLNDLGYEVPASEAIPSGALLSTSSGEGALSKGMPAGALKAETLWNYEAGVHVRAGRLSGRIQAFDAELRDPIVRRTLLFPAGAAPSSLGGLAVNPLPPTAPQAAQGVVAVATPLDPRAVKAFVNDGRSRYYGVEALIEHALSSRWRLEANYTFLAGRDLDPNRPIRRLPPQHGYVGVRYMPSGRRPWIEVGVPFSGAQERLSGGDLDDERIGASRRRRDIADFFAGDRVKQFLDPSSGIFLPTRETLRQIQDRVLPLGSIVNGVRVADDSTRVPTYRKTRGWLSLDVRGGLPLGERVSLYFGVLNLFDRNYRIHGSGIDAPGTQAFAGARYMF